MYFFNSTTCFGSTSSFVKFNKMLVMIVNILTLLCHVIQPSSKLIPFLMHNQCHKVKLEQVEIVKRKTPYNTPLCKIKHAAHVGKCRRENV